MPIHPDVRMHDQGGESAGLALLTKSLEDKEWVVQFEKPKGNPAAIEPATTVLSPYLKFGCVSARLFYAKLIQVITGQMHHSQLWQTWAGVKGSTTSCRWQFWRPGQWYPQDAGMPGWSPWPAQLALHAPDISLI